MPWSNQNGGGGGPWGGGGGKNQSPWGQGQGPNRPRNGGTPPDLEEIIRRSQDRLKAILPGGMNAGIGIIVVVLLVAFWLLNAVYTVQPDERGVESLFGKPKEESAGPGLHFVMWPIETVELVNVAEQQQKIGAAGDQGEGLMLTGDQNIVNVQFSLLFSVSDPRAYLYNVSEPGKTLAQVADSVMREVVGRRPAQDIFRDNRQAVAQEVKDSIQETVNRYQLGVAVNTVSVEDVSPPKEVSSAFDEVQRAEQDEDKMIEQANQYANQVRGQANGEAAKVREGAAAYKNRIVKEAEGEAQRFLSVYEQYQKAPEITRKRIYLETMEQVLQNSKKVITDTPAGQTPVVPYLPLDQLAKPADKGAQK